MVTKRECSLTGMASSAFSRSIACVLEGREWYSGASSCGSRGPAKVSTIHAGNGPGRTVRCQSKLSAALRSWEIAAGCCAFNGNASNRSPGTIVPRGRFILRPIKGRE